MTTPHHVEAAKQLAAAGSCSCSGCVNSLAKTLAKMEAPNTPDHYWYRQGKEDGAQAERERIVAWLRARDGLEDCYSELIGMWLSDRIERGDHLPA